MTDEQTVRITQLWPPSLRDQAKALVGARGLTAFTLEAVRNHLRSQGHEPADAASTTPAPVAEEVEEQPEEARTPRPLPAAIQEQVQRAAPPAPTPIPEPRVEAEEGLADVRGVAIDVPIVEGGAAQQYSSSASKIEAMLAQAQSLGLTVASTLPTPPPPPIVPPEHEPEAVIEPEAEPEPEAVETPAPISTPVPIRNLEDIDVDF